MKLTELQKENMEHALGLNYKNKSFRNYFCTYESDESWTDLVKKKLAVLSVQNINGGKYFYYSVTEKGKELLGDILGITIENA